MNKKSIIVIILSTVLIAWVLIDFFGPWHSDLYRINSTEIARLETDMWRAYYDKNGLLLFRLLAKMLHEHYGFPYLRSNCHAYLAARAAMVFKKGETRSDYEKALPYLENYYKGMKKIGQLNLDPKRTAALELEWWIVHRQRAAEGTGALTQAIANATGDFYQVNPQILGDYAEARALAMIQRDEEAAKDGVSETEWNEINAKLLHSYQALSDALKKAG